MVRYQIWLKTSKRNLSVCSKGRELRRRILLCPISGRLTVELQDWVVDFALDLACALERAGHPQSFVHGHRCDDVVPDISRHLPLGQNCANYQSNYAQKAQGESQNLQTLVGHFYFFFFFFFLFNDLTDQQRRRPPALKVQSPSLSSHSDGFFLSLLCCWQSWLLCYCLSVYSSAVSNIKQQMTAVVRFIKSLGDSSHTCSSAAPWMRKEQRERAFLGGFYHRWAGTRTQFRLIGRTGRHLKFRDVSVSWNRPLRWDHI